MPFPEERDHWPTRCLRALHRDLTDARHVVPSQRSDLFMGHVLPFSCAHRIVEIFLKSVANPLLISDRIPLPLGQ
jgi:hypothetical protein